MAFHHPYLLAGSARRWRDCTDHAVPPRLAARIGAFLLLAMTTGHAAAATYFVDPKVGSDTAAGTSSSAPWETVPGTRTKDNTAFLRSSWGAITQTAKINCGDTILLKAGSTYSTATVSNGGAWRIDPAFYTATCNATKPITIRIASSTEWPGTSGNFTLNGSGIVNSSANWGANGACDGGGNCGLVAIERLSGVIFTGLSDTQRVVMSTVQATTSGKTSGFLVEGPSATTSTKEIQLGWVEVTGKTSFDDGYGIDITDLSNSWVHDVKIHDWLGGGINTNLFQSSHHVEGLVIDRARIERVGPPTQTSSLSLAFYLAGPTFNDAKAGGGVWIRDAYVRDNYGDGIDAYGCNSVGQDGILRIADSLFAGNGRNSANPSVNFGVQSSGDPTECGGSGNALPEQTQISIRDRFYLNRSAGLFFPHGAGSHYAWHDTFFRSNNAALTYDHCGSSNGLFNSIIDSGSGSATPFMSNNCSQPTEHLNHTTPVVRNTRFRATSSTAFFSQDQSLCTADNGSTWTTTRCSNGSCPSGQTCRMRFVNCGNNCGGQQFNDPPGFVAGNGNVLGTQPLNFVASGNACDSGFADGAPNTDSCDLHLQSSSPAIDPPSPVYVLVANGAGNNASTITVRAGTPEPEQVRSPAIGGSNYSSVSGGLSWGARPHIADPRTYFMPPQIHPWAVGDLVQIVGSCTNSPSRFNVPGRARVVSETATTITVDDTCSWADGAGVHWPWTGSTPDLGAYEFGLDGSSGITAPILLSVDPVQP